MSGFPPLAGMRVIDLAREADAYCGKLLGDLGADAIKVEPHNGEPGRRAHGGNLPNTGLSFRHYNTNKRSIALDPIRPGDHGILQSLIAGADAVVLSGTPRELVERGLAPEALLERHPRLVVAAISPFGLSGPRCNWKGCDLVAQALGGMVYVNGHPDGPPLRAWGPQSHHAASLHAAIGVLLALLVRQQTGGGQIVDVSLQESVTSMLEHVGATFHATGEIQKRRGTLHWTRTFHAGKCRDGWVLLSILGDWTSLIEWVKADGAGAEFTDPVWGDVEYRRAHCEPLFAALGRWARSHSVRELVERAQALRLPFAPLLSVTDLPEHPQLLARKFFVSLDGPTYPGAPYRFSATPWRLRSAAPELDEHRGQILGELQAANGRSGADLAPVSKLGSASRPPDSAREEEAPPCRPLHGIRILDFTWVVAGPLATRVLADHGADVIKVERPDAKGLDRRREALHASLNRGKRSIILDMETPRGREIARQLVRHCDVVIDNFSSRVMASWGLSYADLARIKPDVIALGMSGFGRNGPYRDYVSYGPTLQAMSGFTWHMRRPGGEPAGWGFSYSDMVSGYSAAFAILAALWHRLRSGEGQSIDLAQYEALLSFIGPELLAAAAGESVPLPDTPRGAPEGIYRCRDLAPDRGKRDRWCAVAVRSDEEWLHCMQALGEPQWALESHFATHAGRIAHREELDARIEAWTSQRSAEEVMHLLQTAGVPAGIVADAEDLCMHDPHMAARHYWQCLRTEDGRTLRLDAITPHLSRAAGKVVSPSPKPGTDTDQVLREILQMKQTEIDALRSQRILV